MKKKNNYEKTVQVKNIPEELKARKQWVAWRAEDRGNGKIAKVPVNPYTGRNASTSDETTWSDFESAIKCCQDDPGIGGVGFVFSEDDPYVGIDIDNAIDSDGTSSEAAQALLKRFNSYAEISPSGSGYHIIVKSESTPQGRKKGNVELYSSKQFFTMTGNIISDFPETIRDSDEVLQLYDELTENRLKPNNTEPLSSNFKKILTKQYGQRFIALWNGDTSSYYSPSEADLALCRMLAIATSNDDFEIDRLFRQSGLYRGDKWERRDYREGTIRKAMVSHSNHRPVKMTSFALTDLGNGERFAEQNKDKARWCQQWKTWLTWDGQRWHREGDLLARQRAKATVRSIYTEASQASDEDRVKISKHGQRSESVQRVDAMLKAAKAEKGMAIRAEDLDPDGWLLNCSNGIVDLKTGELLSHTPEYLITKMVKVDYKPEATCHNWLSFLDEIMCGDQEMISYLQRAVGYSLTGDTSEQCIFILHGTGANGKSTFLSPINTILQDYAMQSPVETFLDNRKKGANNDVARLQGARFVTASEPNADQRFAENLLKQVTGSDVVSARFLNQEFFDFKPVFKLFLATNHKPKVNSDDRAIWRRLRLIPFEVTIPDHQQDKHLLGKLESELEGILAWAVQGCLEWQKEGLGMPGRIQEATNEYAKEMDTFGRFLDDCCEQDTGLKTNTKALFNRYVGWCHEEGEQPLTKVMFGKKLGELGFEPARDRTGRGWKGVGLLQNYDMTQVPPSTTNTHTNKPMIH